MSRCQAHELTRAHTPTILYSVTSLGTIIVVEPSRSSSYLVVVKSFNDNQLASYSPHDLPAIQAIELRINSSHLAPVPMTTREQREQG